MTTLIRGQPLWEDVGGGGEVCDTMTLDVLP